MKTFTQFVEEQTRPQWATSAALTDITASIFDSYGQQMQALRLPAGYWMDEDDVEGCDGDGI